MCWMSGEHCRSGPGVIKLFSCSTQLSMKFSLLINMKMPTKVSYLLAEKLSCSAMFGKKELAIFRNMKFLTEQNFILS